MTLARRVADLATLELLLDVVTQGSLSRAAAARGISQPSASAAIQRLERQLGLRVLERGPAGSRPTPEGAAIANWAQPVVEAAYALEQEIAELLGERRRRLRIVASYTIAEYLLPVWLATLRRAGPGPEVQVVVANSSSVTQDIAAGHGDLGFVEGLTVLEGLEARPVGHDELVVIVDPSHSWARRQTPLPGTELAAARLVMREPGSGTREVLEQGLQSWRGEHPAEPLIELGSTTAIKQAVMDGAGPAVLSALSVAAELRDGRLRRVDVDGLDLRRTLRAVWRPSTRLHPAAARLLRVCAAAPGQTGQGAGLP